MSKGIEDAADRILDPAIEVVMLILIGIPICSILLAVALASCLICVPLFVPMAPFLYSRVAGGAVRCAIRCRIGRWTFSPRRWSPTADDPERPGRPMRPELPSPCLGAGDAT